MSALDSTKTPRQAAGVITQQAAGKWVLLDVKSGQYYALDAIAGRIWQLCDGTRNVRQIADAMREEYHTEGEPVEDDVVAFVSELTGESLLV